MQGEHYALTPALMCWNSACSHRLTAVRCSEAWVRGRAESVSMHGTPQGVNQAAWAGHGSEGA